MPAVPRVTPLAALRYPSSVAAFQLFQEIQRLVHGAHLGTGHPACGVQLAEQHEIIENAIKALPEPFRDVYVLADVEGLPNTEIADMLGLSLPAVKSRLHRARLRMRDALAPHFEGGLAS